MKKTTPIFRLIACAIISSATFFACQQDDLSSEEFVTANVKASTTLVSETSTANLQDYSEDCASICIEEGTNTYYKKSGSKTVQAGGSANTKNVSYEIYNTESQLFIYVTYSPTGPNSSKAKLNININGSERTVEKIDSEITISHQIDLPENWQACDVIPFTIFQEGFIEDVTFEGSYALVGICTDTCEDSFNYEKNVDGSYTFTYISAEDVTNAEVKFTCPHITDFTALDGKEYTINPGKGNGSPTVLTWTGNLEACEEITFTILFDADCEQNNADFAILFADFKVNEVSKKGEKENIKFDCSAE